jgi:hypothetical protein
MAAAITLACTSSNTNASASNHPDAGVANMADATLDGMNDLDATDADENPDHPADAFEEAVSRVLAIADASGGYPVDAYGQCTWPAYLDDAGPGACGVGRAFVQCSYPSGVTCDGGGGAFSPQGVDQDCISNDPASCSGCTSTTGAATCKSICAPNEYAVSCGGPPDFSPDGNSSFENQEAPDGCVGVFGTPAGNGYFCCPCE